MNKATGADEAAAVTSAAVPGLGAVFAAVMLVATLLPVTRGVESPAIWVAAAFAVVTVVAFLASRHGSLDRQLAAVVACASSIVVVVLSGYALNQGIPVSIDVPGIQSSFSLVFAAFVTGGLAVGVAVADYFGIGLAGLKERTQRTTILSALGFGGLLAPQVGALVIALPVMASVGELSRVQSVVVSQLGMALGTGVLVWWYLSVTGRDLSYIDLGRPTGRNLLLIVGGVLTIFGALGAITLLFQSTGVESADHGTTQQAAENPEILLVLVPASILVIGPFEELLYRNIIQKSLYESFSRGGAILVGGVIFAIIHTQAYWTAGPGQVVASLAVIFGLALVLGTLYERTENLLVPALVHGVYNAVLFANLYFTYSA
ncbi:CPBP family intramembrane glutamic endopeptidase [Natrialba taiwanensis]|uniref:Abortive infection protein n=1 Tax=Natrialba taiwanensis DSM 12281 TaxID=1230458 RepID=L9ZUK5_9EURY|nr:type II CAAX endopeptidase family protein [Natrialba taiwanensis]ELY88843.1 abortive infection protein [Natrialba taiwanensis DSM 12281]